MNKHTFFLFLAIIITSWFDKRTKKQRYPSPSGKSIYIPKELQGMDLQNPGSQWSYHLWHTPRTSSSSGRRASAMTSATHHSWRGIP